MQILPNIKEMVPKLDSPNGISRGQGREPTAIHFGGKKLKEEHVTTMSEL